MYAAMGSHCDYGSFFLTMPYHQFILYIIAVSVVGLVRQRQPHPLC